jgi:6-phosphogluconolactonase (cycloisomerase 2 family)
VSYNRNADGTLAQAAITDTGGLGGQLVGSVVDHLASQNSLVASPDGRTLYAVNAGSNTISVLSVHGARLDVRQQITSGGQFPVSIAAREDVVYVLNARDGGSLQGYRAEDGRLQLVPSWHRALGIDTTAAPEFVHTPGQVIFTPDGSQLLVPTKAGSHAVLSFKVSESGRPAAAPVVNTLPGTVPFDGVFDGAGHFLLTEVGIGSLVSFTVNKDGTLTSLSSVPTTQAATCWVAPAGGYFYTGNAGGNGTPGQGSLTGFSSTPSGSLTNLGSTATNAGTVDAAGSSDGKFLYTQTGGAGTVDEFAVATDGTLTALGSVTVPDAAGGEGIVAQ